MLNIYNHFVSTVMRKTNVAYPAFKVISHHGFAEIWLNIHTDQRSAAVAFEPGQVFIKFRTGFTQTHATYLTI